MNWIAPEHSGQGNSPLATIEDLGIMNPALVTTGLHTNKDGVLEASEEFVSNEDFFEEYPQSLGICPLMGNKKVFWEEHTYTDEDGTKIRKLERLDFRGEEFERTADRFPVKSEHATQEEITILINEFGRWLPVHDWGLLPSFGESDVLVVNETADYIQDSQQGALDNELRTKAKIHNEVYNEKIDFERSMKRFESLNRARASRKAAIMRRGHLLATGAIEPVIVSDPN